MIVPKSPDVASMEKYIDIPVSENSGTVNLEIPLATINIGKFTLPIGLSYHKNGLMVEEVPSSVGDGWTLNYTGMVSFHQNGINDFKQFGMFYGGVTASGALLDIKKFFKGQMTTFERGTYLDRIMNSQEDSEFDLYNYEFFGKSGMFFYDTLMNPVIIPRSEIKVIKNADTIQITDNENNNYYFANQEYSYTLETSDIEYRPSFNDISAYYLTKVITSENRTILFKYKSYSYTISHSKTLINHFPYNQTGCPSSSVDGFTENSYFGCLLPDSIIFDKGYVKFLISMETRADINGVSPGNFVPYVKGLFINNSDGERVKEYAFTQGYFDTNKRLKLSAVNEINGALTSKSWKFKYYNEMGIFPSFISYSKDHWGFYNGKSNGSLIPNAPYENILLNWRTYSVSYADRNSDFSSVLGMLQEVDYPTGGSSVFEYEPNQIKVRSYNEITSLSPFLTISNATYFTPLSSASTTLSTSPVSGSFIVPASVGGGDPTVQLHGAVIYDPTHFSDPLYQFTGPDKVSTDKLYNVLGMNYSSSNNTSGGTVIDTLSPGTYTYTFTPGQSSDGPPMQYNLNFNIALEQQNAPIPYIVGGVRIAKITQNDSTNRSPKYRRYIYTDSLSQVTFRNVPFYISQTDVNVPNQQGTACYSCGIRASVFDENIAPAAGSHIEYEKVTMYDSSSIGQLGKTESVYLMSVNEAGSYVDPFVVPVNSFWRAGAPVSKKEYKSSGGLFQLVKETQNGYLESDRLKLTNGIRVGYNSYCPVNNNQDRTYNISLSTFFTKQFNLQSTNIYEYLPTQNLLTQNLYTINSPFHSLPTIATSPDSKNNQMSEKTIYSFDYDTSNVSNTDILAIRNLQRKNILIPIEKIQYKTIGGVNYVIGGVLNTYKQDKPVPDKIYNLRLSAPIPMTSFVFSNTLSNSGNFTKDFRYEVDYSFNNYNEFNQILDIVPSNAGPVTYLYDYSKLYAVAEVKNATNADIAYSSFESDQQGNWIYTGATIADATSPTGSRCYNTTLGAISRTGLQSTKKYIVSYWTRNTTSFTIAGTISGYPVKGRSVNGWTFYMHKITGVTSIGITGGLIDELRLFPDNGMMRSYTYSPHKGVTSICDENNAITYYFYDNLGRLSLVKDLNGKVLKSVDYQYKKSITQ
ncbi:hypothetical protein GCM10022209_30880 [Chitinophaga oryziterrae]